MLKTWYCIEDINNDWSNGTRDKETAMKWVEAGNKVLIIEETWDGDNMIDNCAVGYLE